MIRISRGDEPAELREIRERELPRLRALAGDPSHELRSRDFGSGYRVAAAALWRAQGYKCCYCEAALPRLEYNDVEHFRPKTRAHRGPGFPDDGYYWLAWSWENLLYACPFCNRTGKNSRFPLAEGSPWLAPEEFPPGGERPLLIDPGDPDDTDPVDEILFEQIIVERKARWIPRGRGRRGQTSIEVLRLDDDVLIEANLRHLRNNVHPAIDHFRDSILPTRDSKRIYKEWRRMLLRFLRRDSAHAGLNYHVLERRVDPDTRRTWGLELPRPPMDL